MPRHTTELQDRIIDFLVENGPSTTTQISEAFGMSYREISPSIMRLEGRRIRRAEWRDDRRLWMVIRC